MIRFDYRDQYGTYERCYFRVGEYENKNLALDIWHDELGCITHVTVNPDIPIPQNMIAIKDYSENEGMVSRMIKLGIIEESPLQIIKSGWVEIPVYRLTKYGKQIIVLT